jgi:hypothetical protein
MSKQFNTQQEAVVSAADAVSRSDASLKQSLAALVGEKLKAGKLALIPNDEQNTLVSDLLKLVRTAADGETIWSVKDCREAKPGTVMHKAGQRYEAISKAYSRMKPKAEKAKGGKKAEAAAEAEADPKKPGNVVVLPVKAGEIVGFCDSMATMLANVETAEYDIARVKAALVALKEAASKPVGKKK